LKRIGITQRVERVLDHGENRDCLDQNWTRLSEHLQLDLIPIPNAHTNIVDWARRQSLDGLILSGGNDLVHLPGADKPAPERDASERALLNWASKDSLPVLGVCRGMQMINVFLGGVLSPVQGHVACHHIVTSCSDTSLFSTIGNVNSFHNWGIQQSGLAHELNALVLASDNTVEAFRHSELPWFGIMWHPERENGNSHAIDSALLKAIFKVSE